MPEKMADVSPPPEAPKGPLDRLIDRVLELPPARWLIPILDSYDAAGGGLLASGLAFSSLFAILPAILLMVGIVGVVLGEPGRVAAIAADLSTRFPPLAGFFDEALAGFAEGAVTYSILGVVALVWGASRFYQSLDDALARLFESTVRRDPLQRGIRGILSVFVLGGVAGVVIAISHLASAVLSTAIGASVLSIAVFSIGVALVYRIVPTNPPTLAAIGLPAAVVGAFAAVFTAAFALLTPQLVGSLRVYGAFVAVFAAMIWLSFVSQGLLIGAAWVHRRQREAEAQPGP
jgi:membrane protein